MEAASSLPLPHSPGQCHHLWLLAGSEAGRDLVGLAVGNPFLPGVLAAIFVETGLGAEVHGSQIKI